MFIIEKPYASEFMIDTIVQNDWDILDNDVVQNSGIEKGALNLVSSRDAREFYLKQEFPLIYANSENAISWVIENLPKSNLSSYIRLFKDKIEFRKLLQTIYPEFFFREVEYSEIMTIDAKDIRFPFVIKPSVGFLSLGVHAVRNADEWNTAVKELDKEIASAKELYPTEVVNSSKFIIEELIEGDEYAIDAYYDRNGDAVILKQQTGLLYLCPGQYLIEGLAGALLEHSLNMPFTVAEPVANVIKADSLEVFLYI